MTYFSYCLFEDDTSIKIFGSIFKSKETNLILPVDQKIFETIMTMICQDNEVEEEFLEEFDGKFLFMGPYIIPDNDAEAKVYVNRLVQDYLTFYNNHEEYNKKLVYFNGHPAPSILNRDLYPPEDQEFIDKHINVANMNDKNIKDWFRSL